MDKQRKQNWLKYVVKQTLDRYYDNIVCARTESEFDFYKLRYEVQAKIFAEAIGVDSGKLESILTEVA